MHVKYTEASLIGCEANNTPKQKQRCQWVEVVETKVSMSKVDASLWTLSRVILWKLLETSQQQQHKKWWATKHTTLALQSIRCSYADKRVAPQRPTSQQNHRLSCTERARRASQEWPLAT